VARKQRSKRTGTVIRKGGRGPWIAKWFDHQGRRRERSTGCTDHGAALRILAKYVNDAALRREGVIDAREDAYLAADRRPIGEHLDAYRADLIGRKNTAAYVEERYQKAKRALEAANVEHMSDMTVARVHSGLSSIEAAGAPSDGKKGPSLRTLNKYIAAVKGFSRWLRQERRAREHQLEGLALFNEAEDPRHQRRDLTDDELATLIRVTATRDIPGGMTGKDRAALYLLAATTGYRRNELKCLTTTSFELDANPPCVAVPAAFTKAGRDDRQPIRRDVADYLRSWLAVKPSGTAVFACMPANTARTLRWDLKAARIPYEVDGKVFDFHSLRGAYISRIERTGASVKTLQRLSRHVDPRLTLTRYARLRVHDAAAAVEAMPSPLRPTQGSSPESLRATGTDDRVATAESARHLFCHQLGREHAPSGAASCGVATSPVLMHDSRKCLETGELREDTRSSAAGREVRPHGDSNPSRRLEKPVS
jgi:integrase